MAARGLRRKQLIVSALTVALCFAAAEVALRSAPYEELEFEADPELYWKLVPNQRGFMWLAGGTRRSPIARINALGLRGRDVEEKTTGALRILILGDSYTFGSGVADDETFSAVLERQLGEPVEVINAGVPGYGIFQFVELFRRLGPALRPDIVIVTFPTGDVLRQPFARPEDAESHRRMRQRRLWIRRVSRVAAYIHRQIQHVHARLTGTSLGSPTRVPHAQAAAMWDRDQARLMEIAAACKRLPTELIVVPWPQGWAAQWNPLVEAGVRQVSQQTGATASLGLGQALASADGVELEIAGDGHPTAAAHRIAAAYIAAETRKLARGLPVADGSARGTPVPAGSQLE